MIKVVLVLLLLCTSAWAGPDLPPNVYLIAPGGTERTPWADDGSNTVVDGGVTRYFSSSGVDQGQCTDPDNPCQSLSKMYAVRQSRDNILFRRGSTYTGSLQVNTSPSGTSNDWTIYGSYGPSSSNRPRFNNSGSQNIQDRKYIQVDRLHFVNADVWRLQTGVDGFDFTRSRLEKSPKTGFQMSDVGSGDQGPDGPGIPKNIVIAASQLQTGQDAFNSSGQCKNANDGWETIYLGNSNDPDAEGPKNVHVYNNLMHGSSKETVNFKTHTQNFLLERNLIQGISMCNDPGIISGRDFSGLQNIVIDSNIIRDVHHQFGGSAVFAVGLNTTVTNNIVSDVKSSFSLVEIHSKSAGTAKVHHNTFWNWAGGTVVAGSGSNGSIKNNLIPFSGNVTPTASMFVNPSAGDFRLSQTSAALDVYSNCLGVTKDVQGNNRPINGTCDAGAFELGIAPVGITIISFSLGGDFASTPVRDNFNRANENPLANGTWLGPVLPAETDMQVLSNVAAPVVNTSASRYWSTATFNGPQEVFGTMSQQQPSSRAVLFACMQGGMGTAGVDGYQLRARRSPVGAPEDLDIIEVFRIDNGSDLKRGGSITFPAGSLYPEQIGMRIGTNGDLEVFRGDTSLGVVATDTTYSCANTRIGLGGNNTLNTIDDFGGGTSNETIPTLSGIETLTASCTDEDGVREMCFKVDGSSVGCDPTAPYSIEWDTTSRVNGSYSMTATCEDTSSEITETQPLPFTIDNAEPEEPPTDTTDPVTTIITPPPSSVAGILTVEATCTDNAACAQVEFFANGVAFATDVATTPKTTFSGNWNTEGLTPGVYQVTAVGRDHAGNTHTSAPLTVVVIALYPVIEDATICEIPASCGHSGRVTNIVLHNANNEFQTYLKFDISNLDFATVVDANLTVNVSGLVSGSTVQAYAAASDTWSEETIAWNSAPGLGAQLDEVPISGKGEISFDVTDLAASVLAGPEPKILSVVLRDKNTTGKGFHLDSKEQGVMAPTLVITGGDDDPVPPSAIGLTIPNLVSSAFENANVEWTATCTDDYGVHRVDLFADDQRVASDTTFPYGGTWTPILTGDATFTLRAKCYDFGGGVIASTEQVVTIDITAPVLDNLIALAMASDDVMLAWNLFEVSAGVTTTNIRRCNPSPCTPAQQSTTTTNPHSVTGLTSGVAYDFEVQACDNVGNCSANSNKVSASRNELVAFYKFNGNCNDSSINANTCAITGNPTYTAGPFGAEQAILLDGNDYATATAIAAYNITTGLSVSFWTQGVSGIATADYFVAMDDGPNRRFAVRVDASDVNTINGLVVQSDLTRAASTSSGWDLTNWHLITLTHDGSNVRTYIDGVLRQTTAAVGPIDQDSVNLTMGARGDNTRHLTGKLKNVRMYNKALSASHVQYLWSQKLTGMEGLYSSAVEANTYASYADNDEVWANNELGNGLSVPPPFEDVERSGQVFDVWGRTYTFGATGLLPTQISSQGQNLFASAPSLTVTSYGTVVGAGANTVQVLKETPQRADLRTTVQGTNVSVVVDWNLEYDGFLRGTARIIPKGPWVQVEDVTLRLPITKALAERYGWYLPYDFENFSSDRTLILESAGEIEATNITEPFNPTIWIGNDDVGLEFITQTNVDIHVSDTATVTTIDPEASSNDLIINFLDGPYRLDGELVYSFALLATPVKEMPADWRTIHFSSLATAPSNSVATQATLGADWQVVNPANFNTVQLQYPGLPRHLPGTTAAYQSAIATLHGATPKPVLYTPYSALYAWVTTISEFANWRNTWQSSALRNGLWSSFTGSNPSTQPVAYDHKSIQDFALYEHHQALTVYGIDGSYWDFANLTEIDLLLTRYFPTANPATKVFFPIWSSRRFLQRHYQMVTAIDPDYLITHHTNRTSNWHGAYVSVFFTGENYNKVFEQPGATKTAGVFDDPATMYLPNYQSLPYIIFPQEYRQTPGFATFLLPQIDKFMGTHFDTHVAEYLAYSREMLGPIYSNGMNYFQTRFDNSLRLPLRAAVSKFGKLSNDKVFLPPVRTGTADGIEVGGFVNAASTKSLLTFSNYTGSSDNIVFDIHELLPGVTITGGINAETDAALTTDPDEITLTIPAKGFVMTVIDLVP